MGLPPTQILAYTTFLILDAGFDNRWTIAPDLAFCTDFFDDFLEKTRSAIRKCTELSDRKLAERFLDSYDGLHKLFRAGKSPEQRAHNRLVRDYCCAFIQSSLSTILSVSDDDQDESSDICAPFLSSHRNEAAVGSGPLFSTMALSLRSEDLASLCCFLFFFVVLSFFFFCC